MDEKEGVFGSFYLRGAGGVSRLYPNVEALFALREATGGAIDFCTEPVDATRVPPTLTGVRTMRNLRDALQFHLRETEQLAAHVKKEHF